jgi:hypothetical protein
MTESYDIFKRINIIIIIIIIIILNKKKLIEKKEKSKMIYLHIKKINKNKNKTN